VLSYDALADGVPAEHMVDRLMAAVPLPEVSPRQSANHRPVAAARPLDRPA
jgi:MoxR-like ATPase